MSIRLVLADDHPLVLDALENLFALHKDIDVVARCFTGAETLEAVRAHRPDVLVLDLRLPEQNGVSVLRALRDAGPATRVVVLTAAIDEREVLEAIQLGVRGLVLKEAAPHTLVDCIRRVHGGGQCIDQRFLGRALDSLLRREAGMREAAAVLTRREIEIVRMVAEGLRNKEIASRLTITEGTVKIHLHHIYEKLGVDSRVELTLYAQSKGVL